MNNPVAIASQAAENKKANDIKTLDIRANSSFTDFFVLATGMNIVHTRAVADSIVDELAQHDIHPYSKQGYQQGEWILLDYLDFVVHVLVPEAREFYQLERLWQQS